MKRTLQIEAEVIKNKFMLRTEIARAEFADGLVLQISTTPNGLVVIGERDPDENGWTDYVIWPEALINAVCGDLQDLRNEVKTVAFRTEPTSKT